jgi:hypothetical protein
MAGQIPRGDRDYLSAEGGSIVAEQGSSLKATVQLFQAIQRVQQLRTGIAHLVAGASELLRVLDGGPDAFDHYTRLVRHLELKRRRARVDLRFDHLDDLLHDLRTHRDPFIT